MCFFLAVCVSSCVEVEVIEPDDSQAQGNAVPEYPDSVYFILSPPNPQTKVVYTSESHSLFEREDLVGCFALKSDLTLMEEENYKANSCYRVAVHTNLDPSVGDRYFLAPMTVSDNLPLAEGIRYLFYYPYKEDMTWEKMTDLTHTVLDDQNDRDRYEASDLLWDVCTPVYGDKYVEVRMDHAMANIIVEVPTDMIAEDKVPVLLNFKLSASGIDLTNDSGSMTYDVTGADKLIMWEFGKAVSGNYMFRAVVPAQTISAGTNVVQIPDPSDASKFHNFKTQKDMTLLPGRNYFFNVKKPEAAEEQITPPQVVEDRDSWVYDVLHPETGQPIGLLCKEYLCFQPGHTYTDPDRNTGTDYRGETKYISSQAWVLYGYKDSGVPDLNTGQVFRFIYDVRNAGEGGTSNLWPLPHLNAYDSCGGFFTPSHGHEWVGVTGEGGLYGAESSTFVEHYMHGGKVIWDGVNNRIEWFELPVDDPSTTDLDESRITNQQALDHAHVAIGDDGKPYVCYHPVDIYAPHKIGILSPHYLVDRRVNVSRAVDERVYPLVKIGYNQFWMSYPLRAATQIDGTPITNYNTVGFPEVSLPSHIPDVNAGYIFANVKLANTETFEEKSYSYYDPFNDFPTKEEREERMISPMYNFKTLEESGMVPESHFTGGQYYMPDRTAVTSMMKYLGWHFGAKLMTRQVRTRNGSAAVEGEYSALLEGKYTDVNNANRYGANICGFDLRAEGYYYNKNFMDVGRTGGMLLKEGDDCYIFNLPYYLLFDTYSNPDGLLSRTDICIVAYPGNASQDPAVMFAPLRFYLKFNGQADNSGSGYSLNSLSADTKAQSVEYPSRDVYIGLELSE